MAHLRELFKELGHQEVSTYIASGNVLFRSRSSEAALTKSLERALAKRFRFPIRVVLRSASELRRVSVRPLPGAFDIARVHVAFCAAKPKGPLEPERSPRDSFTVHGREIYLHLPDGVGKTRFTHDYIERRIGVPATMRNWRTVTMLAERLTG
jgi:uncharacterized protein (DUF1697 family)